MSKDCEDARLWEWTGKDDKKSRYVVEKGKEEKERKN